MPFTLAYAIIRLILSLMVVLVRGDVSNAICERIVGTLRRELLDQMLIFNERHLSKALAEYAEHYNNHRPHQSRGQRPPSAETTARQPITDLADLLSIRRQPVLDGLINQYHRAA